MPARTAKAKPPVQVTVADDRTAPAVVRAAQIAFRVMVLAKTSTWAEAVADPELTARVRLTGEQQSLLTENRGVLPYLVRQGTVITVVGCDRCGRFVFADNKATTTKCSLTLGCTGALVKASTVPPRARKAT